MNASASKIDFPAFFDEVSGLSNSFSLKLDGRTADRLLEQYMLADSDDRNHFREKVVEAFFWHNPDVLIDFISNQSIETNGGESWQHDELRALGEVLCEYIGQGGVCDDDNRQRFVQLDKAFAESAAHLMQFTPQDYTSLGTDLLTGFVYYAPPGIAIPAAVLQGIADTCDHYLTIATVENPSALDENMAQIVESLGGLIGALARRQKDVPDALDVFGEYPSLQRAVEIFCASPDDTFARDMCDLAEALNKEGFFLGTDVTLDDDEKRGLHDSGNDEDDDDPEPGASSAGNDDDYCFESSDAVDFNQGEDDEELPDGEDGDDSEGEDPPPDEDDDTSGASPSRNDAGLTRLHSLVQRYRR
ncbi:MAG: hypothetical protein AB7G06_04090 [Bdellovibrionales bacterium]